MSTRSDSLHDLLQGVLDSHVEQMPSPAELATGYGIPLPAPAPGWLGGSACERYELPASDPFPAARLLARDETLICLELDWPCWAGSELEHQVHALGDADSQRPIDVPDRPSGFLVQEWVFGARGLALHLAIPYEEDSAQPWGLRRLRVFAPRSVARYDAELWLRKATIRFLPPE